MEHSDTNSDRPWYFWGKSVPKSEIVFGTQVFLIYIIVVTSIVNLSLNGSEGDSKIWIILLSSCLGYILPNPKLKHHGTL
jgi:hypothetical protein